MALSTSQWVKIPAMGKLSSTAHREKPDVYESARKVRDNMESDMTRAEIRCSPERRAHVWTRTIRTVGRNVVAATGRPSRNGYAA